MKTEKELLEFAYGLIQSASPDVSSPDFVNCGVMGFRHDLMNNPKYLEVTDSLSAAQLGEICALAMSGKSLSPLRMTYMDKIGLGDVELMETVRWGTTLSCIAHCVVTSAMFDICCAERAIDGHKDGLYALDQIPANLIDFVLKRRANPVHA